MKGKKLRPEPRPHVRAVKPAREFVEDVFQVGHGDALVHDEPFELVEEEAVRGVHGVGAIDPAGRDDADGRPALLHHADLHRARLAAQQHVVVEEERVEGVARRMVLGDVQRLEVVVVALDLGAEGDLEAEPDEDVLDRGDGLRERMEPAARDGPAGEREIERRASRLPARAANAASRLRARSRCSAESR